jgi:hypothetical protein
MVIIIFILQTQKSFCLIFFLLLVFISHFLFDCIAQFLSHKVYYIFFFPIEFFFHLSKEVNDV